MERFENGSDMSGFRSLNNSTSKTVLNLLEPVKLTVWKVMIERVTVVKFRVNYGGGNGAGCFVFSSSRCIVSDMHAHNGCAICTAVITLILQLFVRALLNVQRRLFSHSVLCRLYKQRELRHSVEQAHPYRFQ